MTVPSPDLLAAYAQTIAKVLAPLVLLATGIFALRAPRPEEDDGG
jgi:hypothetical protein